MKLFIMPEQEINDAVSNQIVALINNKPNCILGLATGGTPVGVYEQLIKKFQNNEVSFKNVRTYNLDEYVGLNSENEQSYHYFMKKVLFNYIDIDLDNTHVPDGENVEKSIKSYDEDIQNAGGIDLQILGIGSNGHIAFNEPGTPFDTLTHVVNLKESTIRDNSRFFKNINEVPRQSITMGLASIMKAKKIVLIAKGERKAEVIRKLFQEEQSEDLPASILKTHPNVEIYCDNLAAKYLK
ncbi:MAG: glucosamine-6-phosphate deaminase [Erysipelotrichales bacterium]|nr:glucosamine-6-phosphate deaminase [Erysipelotrichales bacterium]